MSDDELLAEIVSVPEADRLAWLAERCAGEAAQSARVLARLAATTGTVDQPPAVTQTFDSTQPHTVPGSGSRVIAGRYTLTSRIGEGGMGEVWAAVQSEPVRRRVALKLILGGRDATQVVRRFEAERQALALMDHPNIARIYDGGTTDTGAPYFVMELVEGQTITRFCDSRRLGIAARLELFVFVCQAVQHAHQKGIIHRDLKPGNILVTEVDGRPTPKVIDFGVAKAVGHSLIDGSLHDTGAIVGTPAYMSPEQADPATADIDTRTDVYALGVVLYELLVGSPPLTVGLLQRGAVLEMLRMVREVDPLRLSERLSTAEDGPTLAANRSTEPGQLHRDLRGDLEWITFKALEKDRNRRYDTPNGLAADVLRHLAGEAVQAHPPSRRYRLRKFVRRNRGIVLAASTVLFALVAGLAGTTLGLLEARRQAAIARTEAMEKELARQAEADQRQLADTRRADAERNLAYATRGVAILGTVFEGLDPQEIAKSGQPIQDFLKGNLQQAARELEAAALDDPRTLANLQTTLGVSLMRLGDREVSITLLEKAFETDKLVRGPDDPETLKCQNFLGTAYSRAGEFDRAISLIEDAIRRSDANPNPITAWLSRNNLAQNLYQTGQFARAVTVLEDLLPQVQTQFGPQANETLRVQADLADALSFAGDTRRPAGLWEQVLETRLAVNGPQHPETILAQTKLGVVYLEMDQLQKAMPLLNQALSSARVHLGLDHPTTIACLANLARGHLSSGQYDQAAELSTTGLQLTRTRYPAGHPEILTALNNLATSHLARGRFDLAAPLFEECLALKRTKLGPTNPSTLATMANLASCYQENGEPEKGLPLMRETLQLMRDTLGPDHPNTLSCLGNLAVGYTDINDYAQARPLMEDHLSRLRAKLGPDHFATLNSLRRLALTQLHLKDHATAKVLLDEYVPGLRKRFMSNPAELSAQLTRLGGELLDVQQAVMAEPLLREALALREQTEPGVWTTFNTQSLLGQALLGQRKFAEAEPLLKASYDGLKAQVSTIPPKAGPRVADALDHLIRLYTSTRQPDQVEVYRKLRSGYPAEVAPAPSLVK